MIVYSRGDHVLQRETKCAGGFVLCRFMEQDVALILALLTAAGFQLRRDDPAAMKARRCSAKNVDSSDCCHVDSQATDWCPDGGSERELFGRHCRLLGPCACMESGT